jgi:hypothetical protein
MESYSALLRKLFGFFFLLETYYLLFVNHVYHRVITYKIKVNISTNFSPLQDSLRTMLYYDSIQLNSLRSSVE